MVIFKWSRVLETGIPLIDKQHHELIETANRFFIRHKCGADNAAVADCLRFLQQYIQYHFQAEEAFQRDCVYPDYPRHSALHKSMSTALTFLAVKIQASNYSEQSIASFYNFLTELVATHIYEEDLAFAGYYRNHIAKCLDTICDAPTIEPTDDTNLS